MKIFGVDKNHPSPVIDVHAPISGVIIGQNVTNAAAAGVSLSGSATAFTIADLSSVWILCDVYENDIPTLQVGQEAQIELNAYPDRPLSGASATSGRFSIPAFAPRRCGSKIANPGILKLGMFVTATFTSRTKETIAVVPANAILHLHDRDWVFIPAGGNQFPTHRGARRQHALTAIDSRFFPASQPGQQVVTNALLLDAAGNQ